MVFKTMLYPSFSNPWWLAVRFAFSVVFGLKRSFRQDSIYFISKLRPPLQILGADCIPTSGPVLITMNHYYRPGFRAWWLALGINSLVPADISWIMAAAWTFPNQFLGELRTTITQNVFRRIAYVYSLTTMPPMPPRPHETLARALAVRKVLDLIRSQSRAGFPPIIGLAPEGGDNLSGTLAMPASGVGRFIYHLDRSGLIIHPVGAYEQDGVFIVHFGQPYHLSISDGLSPDQRDTHVRTVVMQRIAFLLPDRLRGEFDQSEITG